MSLLFSLLKQAVLHPRRIAVVDDRRSYAYAEIIGGAFYLAEDITHATSANHIGLMLPTSGAFPIALTGAWLARRVPVPLNYLLSPEELAYIVKDSEIDTIYTVEAMIDHLGGEDAMPKGVKIRKMDQMSFSGLPEPRWPPYFSRDDLAVLVYTSATTGRPKGVMLTHGNLQSNVSAAIKHAGLDSSDVFLGVLPQFHCFGLTVLTLVPLSIGSKIVYTARFQPKKILDLIREHKPDAFIGVPSMFGAMLTVKEAQPEDFQNMRLPVSGGEPLPNSILEAFEDRFGVKILEGYGLTETSPVSNWCTPSQQRLYSVGRALPGVSEMAVDEHDQPLPANVDGEILIAGPHVMKGYYKQPEMTDAVMTDLIPRGGGKPLRFFRTGDIGRFDEDGYLYITGRKKEMLIVAGENVFPREIEEALDSHPAVHASAVIGKQDGVRGEVPIAFVQLEEGQTVTSDELRSHCRERIAGYKVPREVHFLDELPRSPTGKVLRRALSVPAEQSKATAGV